MAARFGSSMPNDDLEEVVVVEAAPGVAIVVAAWMLDPVICATMSLGTPTIDVAGLADLDRLPLCQGSCRPDRIGTLGGAGRRTWLDTDGDIRIG